jgi:hypothetical protein
MGTVLDEIPRAAQQARDDERAAVVAWLRVEDYPCCRQCNGTLADAIERGEHRREGGA